MGYQLHREIRRALGPEITAAQRLVALQISLDALDPDAPPKGGEERKPRESRISLAALVQGTGLKNEKVVRTILNQLSTAGWEFRVQITTGIDGRPVYTVPGRALNFRVPSKQGPIKPTKPRSNGADATSVGPYEEIAEGPTLVPSQTTSVVSEATSVVSEATSVGPYVLPSTSSDFLPTSGGSVRADPAGTPPANDEGRKDGAAKEDQNQRTAWDILSGFGLALSSASPRERQALARHVVVKLAEGHTRAAIHDALNRGHLDGVDSPAAVLHHRLDERLHLPAKTPQSPTSNGTTVAPLRQESPLDPTEKADRIRRGVALARATSGAQIAEGRARFRSASSSPTAVSTSVAEAEQPTNVEAEAAAAKAARRVQRDAAVAELLAHQAALAAETRSRPSTDNQGEP